MQANYLYEYHQNIQDGKITVGKWIKLLFEYLVNGIETGLFFFDNKKANDAIEFIETQ